MGMFDTIHCSYDLGEGFTNKDLQTKDLSSLMLDYWLCPNGYLYEINYFDTADFVELTPDDPDYHDTALWANFRWIPNGNHGKVQVTNFTCYCEVYPASWNNEHENYPSKMLHFVNGKLNGTL